jgi:hypothetical protein
VVAHDIKTDTAKKISAVEILQPWRQIHNFMILIVSPETPPWDLCLRNQSVALWYAIN